MNPGGNSAWMPRFIKKCEHGLAECLSDLRAGSGIGTTCIVLMFLTIAGIAGTFFWLHYCK